MADRFFRAQVTIPLHSNLPEDAIVNTWHFDDDDDPIASDTDRSGWIESALTGFYQAIDGVIFPSSVQNAATVRIYDLATPEPRIPLDEFTIALTPTATDPLPGEVAICLSFSATPQAGVNPSRRRGRIFLGPIRTGAAEVVNYQLRPSAATRTAIANAAATLVDGVAHPGSPGLHMKWAIYSPTTDAGGASLADSFNDVVSGWVDNAFDTQRRRGADATLRTVFS